MASIARLLNRNQTIAFAMTVAAAVLQIVVFDHWGITASRLFEAYAGICFRVLLILGVFLAACYAAFRCSFPLPKWPELIRQFLVLLFFGWLQLNTGVLTKNWPDVWLHPQIGNVSGFFLGLFLCLAAFLIRVRPLWRMSLFSDGGDDGDLGAVLHLGPFWLAFSPILYVLIGSPGWLPRLILSLGAACMDLFVMSITTIWGFTCATSTDQ